MILSLLVVAFLHGSVFSQVVQRLQLSGHILSSSDHLLDLLWILNLLVFVKRCSQSIPEVVASFGILTAEIQELKKGVEQHDSSVFTTLAARV